MTSEEKLERAFWQGVETGVLLATVFVSVIVSIAFLVWVIT